MIRFIIIAVIILVVVAFTPLMIHEPGYIAIAMGGKVIELTVYTAVFWLAATLLVCYVVFRFLRGSLKFSFNGWRKFAFASHRKAVRDFNKGISAFALEDYQQAEKLLGKSAEPAHQEQTGYLLAAVAASKQSLPANTNNYIELLEHYTDSQELIKVAGLDAVIVKVKLLMQHQEHTKAREILDEYHKHIGHDNRLLQLEINLCIIEQRFESAINHLSAAKSKKDYSQSDLKQSEKRAFSGMFNDILRQQNQQALFDYWQKLPKKFKQSEAVIFAYCRTLTENNISEPLEKLLLPTLKKDPSEEFITQLTALSLAPVVSQVENLLQAIQKHLHKNPHSIKWLSCLAHFALACGQWQKSEQAFNSLFNVAGYVQNPRDLYAFAASLNAQDKFQQANEILLNLVDKPKTT